MTHDTTRAILWIIGVVAFAFASPFIVKFLHGYIAGAIWQWRDLRRHELIVMRLADMYRLHPAQIIDRCSKCGHEVAIYPSGQRVMQEIPSVKLVCQVCKPPRGRVMLAPGAEHEAFQSRRRETNDQT